MKSREPVLRVHLNVTPFDEQQGIERIIEKIQAKLKEVGIDDESLPHLLIRGISKNTKGKRILNSVGKKNRDKSLNEFKGYNLTSGTDAYDYALSAADQGAGGELQIYDGRIFGTNEIVWKTSAGSIIRASASKCRDALVMILKLTHQEDARPVIDEFVEHDLRMTTQRLEETVAKLLENSSTFGKLVEQLKERGLNREQTISYICQFAIHELLLDYPSLLDPEALADFLHSKEGIDEISKELTLILNNPIENLVLRLIQLKQ